MKVIFCISYRRNQTQFNIHVMVNYEHQTNRLNSVPLYIQLKEKIEEKILDGTYTGKVPSEREFMDEYYISRSTIRQAIDDLTREGTLVKKPSKGM